MQNNLTPEIRFPEFTEPWEQCKLRGILAERNDQITETNEYPLMSFVQGKGVTPKGKRYNRSFLVRDVDKKYKKTELGDFIYSSNNLETGSIGFNRTGKAVISPVYSIFKSKREQESQFIGIMSARKDFIFKMIRFRQGVVYGQWRIHESDFLNIDIRIPSYEEQQSIICFFEKLNKAITLHQRELEGLKKSKQGFLQKMFPKNGESVPEIRFPGFTDDWEERKLGEFVIDYVEKTTTQNQFPVLTSSQQQGIVLQETYFANRQVTTDNNIGYYVLPRGYFTFRNRSDNNVFIFNRNDLIDKGIISYFYPVFTLKNSDSDFFLKRINNGIKRQVSIQAEGTGQRVLSMKKFKNIISMFPSLEEQQKIGSFFKQLDDTIVLHQRELEYLQETKKGFLQKMFI